MADNKLQNYQSNSFNIIKNAEILTAEDFETISNLKESLTDVFLYSQLFRTKTEMEVSILNDTDYPTPDSKYWQSVREQFVMFDNLVLLSYNYRKHIIEIKKLERDLPSKEDELDRELDQIEIEKKQYYLKGMEREAHDRIRELRQWEEIKQKQLLKYDPKDVNAHQLESYTKRWIKQSEILGSGGSAGERFNLIGQMLEGIKQSTKAGLIDKVEGQLDILKEGS